jgi:membrane protease YdiL (CAAX protease family)
MTTHAEPPPTQTAAPERPAPPPAPRPARWRPPVAIGVVLAGLVVSQLVALGILLVAGDSDPVMAGAFVVADLLLVGIIVASAARGAERLTAATLGVRRTRFWRAVGWSAAIMVGVLAIEAIWAALVGGFSNVEEDPAITEAELIMVLFAVAVVTPIAEELAFRGYLFPALTRWRGPWIAAILTAVIFGCAHVLSSPIEALPALAVFGFGACLLFWITGSLLPCVALHAANNALVMSVGGEWTWQVPVAIIACVALSIVVLLPFARESEPHD